MTPHLSWGLQPQLQKNENRDGKEGRGGGHGVFYLLMIIYDI